jgi:hypothetical protein
MRLVAAVLCLALGGCHYLFQLNDLHAPPDASTIDALGIDAFVGPTPAGCWSGAYKGDEDEDMIVDGCDNCPLMRNELQEDRDVDGVGDICDANPDAKLEKIAYFHPMALFNETEWTTDGLGGNWQDNTYGIQQANTGNTQDVSTYARVNTVGRVTFDQPMAQVIVRAAAPDYDGGLSGDNRSAVALYVITGGDSSIGIPSGIRCGLNFPGTSGSSAFGFIEKEGTANVSASASTTNLLPGLITISTLQPGKQPSEEVTPTCSIRTVSETATPIFTAVMKPDKVKIGVWTKNASATFLALFVTERL